MLVLIPVPYSSDMVVDDSVQIVQLQSSSPTITDLLNAKPVTLGMPQNIDYASEQPKDPAVNEMIQLLTDETWDTSFLQHCYLLCLSHVFFTYSKQKADMSAT